MGRRQRSFCEAIVENTVLQFPATLVALLLVPVLPAQVITGQLTGRITDSSRGSLR